jgi:hypothetical protein
MHTKNGLVLERLQPIWPIRQAHFNEDIFNPLGALICACLVTVIPYEAQSIQHYTLRATTINRRSSCVFFRPSPGNLSLPPILGLKGAPYLENFIPHFLFPFCICKYLRTTTIQRRVRGSEGYDIPNIDYTY